MINKKYINPPQLFDSRPYGFSQVVISNPGRHIFISGQVAWDREEKLMGPGNLKLQTHQAFSNLKSAIESADGTLADITMLRLYFVDDSPEAIQIVGEALRNFFGTSSPPASTWIVVKSLASSDFLIEVEAQAIVDAGN
jgi:2-iminobutanoate/2-iminopropanoate deaminase